jgi:hypothetical protein
LFKFMILLNMRRNCMALWHDARWQHDKFELRSSSRMRSCKFSRSSCSAFTVSMPIALLFRRKGCHTISHVFSNGLIWVPEPSSPAACWPYFSDLVDASSCACRGGCSCECHVPTKCVYLCPLGELSLLPCHQSARAPSLRDLSMMASQLSLGCNSKCLAKNGSAIMIRLRAPV